MTTTTDRLAQLGIELQRRKRAAQEFLVAHYDRDILATHRCYGSEHPFTWEDKLQEFSESHHNIGGERAQRLRLAYLTALNRLWGDPDVQRMVERTVASWFTRRRPRGLSREDAQAEAQLRVRSAITSWTPGVGGLEAYLRSAVRRELDQWQAQQAAAVQLPRAAARQGVGMGGAEPLDPEALGERPGYSADAELLHAATTEETDPYWRGFFGYPDED